MKLITSEHKYSSVPIVLAVALKIGSNKKNSVPQPQDVTSEIRPGNASDLLHGRTGKLFNGASYKEVH